MKILHKIYKEYKNIKLIGRFNMFLGLMLVLQVLFAPQITLLSWNSITLLIGAIVMWLGAHDKKDPHPEYQRRLDDYIEEE